MRRHWKIYLVMISITALLMSGCSTNNNSGTGTSTTESTSGTTSGQSSDTGNTSSDNTEDSSSSHSTVTGTTSTVLVDTEFTARELEVGYDESSATLINLNSSSITASSNTGVTIKNSTVTITSEGTYVIAGTLKDGQIIVDAGDKDKVQIVLNGANITCSNNASIYVKNADKVFVTLAENTENTLTDGSNYVQSDDNTVDGVIFSMADLALNGEGTLNITGNYKHGIASKDDLVITSGTYNITAVKDALNGKDCVKIKDGTLNLTAADGDGIQSKNADDTTKGYVYISGGTISVKNCREGIEGTVILVEGGNIDVKAQDDGFNAASASSTTSDSTTENDSALTGMSTAGMSTAGMSTAGISTARMSTVSLSTTISSTTNSSTTNNSTANSSTANSSTTNNSATNRNTTNNNDSSMDGTNDSNLQARGFYGGGGGFGQDGGDFDQNRGEMENNTNCFVSITGGNIYLNASGDGIDSNGSISISGGTVYVDGPTNDGNAGMDYNGTSEITGGTVVVTGSSGMAQGFSDTSTQYSFLYNLTSSSAAGTEVRLTDADGNVVLTYTPKKQYQSVIISTPDLKKDATFTLTCGDQTADITLSSVSTSGGTQSSMGDMKGFGGRGQGGKIMTPPDNQDNSNSVDSSNN